MNAYFGDKADEYKEIFKTGVDMRLMKDVPFALNLPTFNSSIMISEVCTGSGYRSTACMSRRIPTFTIRFPRAKPGREPLPDDVSAERIPPQQGGARSI